MEKTTVYLPRDLHVALRTASRRAGKPQAELIRAAVRAYLESEPRPLPRSIGVAQDGSLTGEESEAWLEAEWEKRWSRSTRQPSSRS